MRNLKTENVKIKTCGRREKREVVSKKEKVFRIINFNDRRQMD